MSDKVRDPWWLEDGDIKAFREAWHNCRDECDEPEADDMLRAGLCAVIARVEGRVRSMRQENMTEASQ